MNSKTIISMLIIILVVFALITIYKLKDFPTGNCCKDIKYPESEVCHTCDYKLWEKIVYVWRFS